MLKKRRKKLPGKFEAMSQTKSRRSPSRWEQVLASIKNGTSEYIVFATYLSHRLLAGQPSSKCPSAVALCDELCRVDMQFRSKHMLERFQLLLKAYLIYPWVFAVG